MNTTVPFIATLAAKKELTGDTVLLTLAADPDSPILHRTTRNGGSVFSSFHPGQFVQLSLPGVGEMPISYCGSPQTDGMLELCVRSVGRVSSALFNLPVGGNVALRGPFGHGFPLEQFHGNDILLIAGGVGMAPIRSLLLALLNERQRFGRLTLLHGAREKQALLFAGELWQFHEQQLLTIHSVVDRLEGGGQSGGYPLCRAGLLPSLIDDCNLDPDRTVAALCAPPAAYPALHETLRHRGITDDRIFLSLERRMKCGIGHCGHCAVGTLLCCTDGPVFSVAQLSAEPEVPW